MTLGFGPAAAHRRREKPLRGGLLGRILVLVLDGGVQPALGAVEPVLADLRELLAAFPQGQGLLEVGAAGLETADHVDELLASLLVARCLAHRSSPRPWSSSGPAVSTGSVRSMVACTQPSATRTVRELPGVAFATLVST